MPGLPCLQAEVLTAKTLQQTWLSGLARHHGPRERNPGFAYPAQNPGRVVLISFGESLNEQEIFSNKNFAGVETEDFSMKYSFVRKIPRHVFYDYR